MIFFTVTLFIVYIIFCFSVTIFILFMISISVTIFCVIITFYFIATILTVFLITITSLVIFLSIIFRFRVYVLSIILVLFISPLKILFDCCNRKNAISLKTSFCHSLRAGFIRTMRKCHTYQKPIPTTRFHQFISDVHWYQTR